MVETSENYIKLILDNDVLDKYNEYYFKQHPRAKKKPIPKPRHESINVWCILPRIQMNALKQRWCDFVVWWMDYEGLSNKGLDSFDMIVTTYFESKRRVDCDNFSTKFIDDGFTKSGFIVDDDSKHMHSLTLKTGYDKDNPRTEIEFFIKNKE